MSIPQKLQKDDIIVKTLNDNGISLVASVSEILYLNEKIPIAYELSQFLVSQTHIKT